MSDNAPDDVTIEDGSDNVFADLDLPNAEERLAKALLARTIRQIVKQRDWTQAKTARQLGMAASDMSDIMRGKVARFSLERFEFVILDLEMDLHIVVSPKQSMGRRGHVSVELVGAS